MIASRVAFLFFAVLTLALPAGLKTSTAEAATKAEIGPAQALAITLPSDLAEGDAVRYGYVAVPNALTADLTVSLGTSDSSVAAVPATVVIPAGQTSVFFGVTVRDDSIEDGPQ